MVDCLAFTGVSTNWFLIMGVLAAIAIGVVLLLIARRKKKFPPTLLLLPLALGGVLLFGTPAPAQAASAIDPCAVSSQPAPDPAPVPSPSPAPTPPPAPTAVTPVDPILVASPSCDVEPTVQIPTVTGIDYAQARVGMTVTITATAQPGFVVADGATVSWTFDVTPTPCGGSGGNN